jgi:uncharacterized protein (DUF433 family)
VARRREITTKQFSIRVAAPVFADLERRAQETAGSRNALAERYIAEGVKMDDHPGIYFRDAALGRRAALVGTRLDVWQVIETLRKHEKSVADTAEYLSLPAEKVRAAVRFYAAYPVEVDDLAERESAYAARGEAAWRAEQKLVSG